MIVFMFLWRGSVRGSRRVLIALETTDVNDDRIQVPVLWWPLISSSKFASCIPKFIIICHLLRDSWLLMPLEDCFRP